MTQRIVKVEEKTRWTVPMCDEFNINSEIFAAALAKVATALGTWRISPVRTRWSQAADAINKSERHNCRRSDATRVPFQVTSSATVASTRPGEQIIRINCNSNICLPGITASDWTLRRKKSHSYTTLAASIQPPVHQMPKNYLMC